MAWGLLDCAFEPADDVAARLLLAEEPRLIVLWDVRDDPEVASTVLSSELGLGFSLELPEGEYHVAAFVFDDLRDEVRGAAASSDAVYVPPDALCPMTLFFEVSDTERLTDELFGDAGPAPAELILPDGVGYPLQPVTIIGRSPDCNVEIEDPTISRYHAQIEWIDEGFWLRDLGSANGSYVNGARVDAEQLYHGDVLGIGSVDLGFRAR